MSSRSRRRSGKSSRWLMILFGLGLILAVLLLLAPMVVMSWVRGYLQQEAFRGKMEQFLGTQLRGEVALAPLRWSGDEVSTANAQITTQQGWTAEVSSLSLALDWNGFREHEWRLINAGMDALELRHPGPSAKTTVPPRAVEELPSETPGQSSSVPGWLRGYLPSKTVFEGLRVDAFAFQYGPWQVKESKLRLGAWQQGEHSVQATVEGGIVETPVQLPTQLVPMKFNLTRATARLSREDVHLSEAILHWLGDSEISVNGHLSPKDGGWKMSTQLSAVPLREIMSDDWKLRLNGLLEADLDIEGGRDQAPRVKGKVELKKAVLTALPILNKLATYTGVERFKRLVFDIATAKVSGSGQTRQFQDIVIQSNGLFRLEGSLHIQGGQMDGRFMIGVTPETLKWIPGAQQHVFTARHTSGPAGMLWTPLRVSGDIDAPSEDLTSRLIGGAGKALLHAPADVVGKTSETLLTPVLGEELAKKPGDVLKGATEAVIKPADSLKKATEATGKAAEKGLDVIRGIGGGLFGK